MTQVPPSIPPQPIGPMPTAPRKAVGLAAAALVLGILAFIPVLGIPFALLAIILGIVALAVRTSAKGLAIAGLVCGATAAFLVHLVGTTMLIPALSRARGPSYLAHCQANLNGIGKAFAIYASEYNDEFPRLTNYGDPNVDLSTDSSVDELWEVEEEENKSLTILTTNSMQNVWILIERGLVTESAFHCPCDSAWARRPREARRYGWTALTQFSYGIQWPYDGLSPEAGPVNKASLTDKLDGGVVIMADRNPGGSVSDGKGGRGAKLRHSNHPRDGVVVLYRSGSVMFHRSVKDSRIGYESDDIYVNNAGQAGGMPMDNPQTPGLDESAYDTSITPHPSR